MKNLWKFFFLFPFSFIVTSNDFLSSVLWHDSRIWKSTGVGNTKKKFIEDSNFVL